MAITRLRTLAIASTVVVAACGGGDDETAATSTTDPIETGSTATEPSTTEPTPTEPTTTEPTTTEPSGTEPDAPTTTGGTTTEPEPDATAPPAGEAGTATVEVGGQRYEFRVIQCLRDRPGAFDDTVIEFTLDGVPVDTPQELVDPLLGEIDPDTDLLPLVEPVAEFGPLLSVSRFEDGGDYVVVYDLDTIEIASDPDPLAVDARFLDVPDGDGATVSGVATAGDGTLTLSATCP